MGPFTESKVHSDGMKHVEIEGFDSEAFETVLHLIHLNHDQIPLDIDLEFLAKICVVCDDLKCYRALPLAKQLWLGRLQDQLQYYDQGSHHFGDTQFDRDLILALFVSHVLGEEKLFRDTSRSVILRCPKDSLPTMGLPIRQAIEGT
jgi:hypothetical protein